MPYLHPASCQLSLRIAHHDSSQHSGMNKLHQAWKCLIQSFIFPPSQSNSFSVRLTYPVAQKYITWESSSPSEFFWQYKLEHYYEDHLGLKKISGVLRGCCSTCPMQNLAETTHARGWKHYWSISVLQATLACQTGSLAALTFCHNLERPVGIINTEANSFRISYQIGKTQKVKLNRETN